MNMGNPLKKLCTFGAILISKYSGHAVELEGSFMTVRGSIPVAEIGKTLTHEHVLVDFIGAEESGYHRWNREEVISVMLPRLMAVRDLGDESLFGVYPRVFGKESSTASKTV